MIAIIAASFCIHVNTEANRVTVETGTRNPVKTDFYYTDRDRIVWHRRTPRLVRIALRNHIAASKRLVNSGQDPMLQSSVCRNRPLFIPRPEIV